MRRPACPTCRKPASDAADTRFAPFCSERCKAIDLARWFMGNYKVASDPLGSGELGAEMGDEELAQAMASAEAQGHEGDERPRKPSKAAAGKPPKPRRGVH